MNVSALYESATRELRVLSRRGHVDELCRVGPALLRRGVGVRIVAPDSARTERPVAGELVALAAAGAQVRAAPAVPADAVVIDDAVAVLPLDDATRSPAAFRLSAIVTTTAELFERVWLSAQPLIVPSTMSLTLPERTPAGPGSNGVPCPRERELLSLLSNGCTDESAAARLGVSVRTVRRLVADLMHRLDARSRFQAGARAADRGWLLNMPAEQPIAADPTRIARACG